MHGKYFSECQKPTVPQTNNDEDLTTVVTAKIFMGAPCRTTNKITGSVDSGNNTFSVMSSEQDANKLPCGSHFIAFTSFCNVNSTTDANQHHLHDSDVFTGEMQNIFCSMALP